MRYTLTRISPKKSAYFSAWSAFFVALLYAALIFTKLFVGSAGIDAVPGTLILIVTVLFLGPIIGLVAGYLQALLFNFVAQLVGGLDMEFQERETEPGSTLQTHGGT